MATSEDDIAKKEVQEAVWTWSFRFVVLAVTFGFGLFTGWVLWGAGIQGAPALRKQVVDMDARILELKNKQVDIEGQLTVTKDRLTKCDADRQRCLAAPTAPR